MRRVPGWGLYFLLFGEREWPESVGMVFKCLVLSAVSFQGLGAAGLKKTADLDYVGGGNPRQTLDLYLPEGKSKSALPVIFWIHGGAWAKGSKDGAGMALRAAQSGDCAVVSINYRLTNEVGWPAQLHDCKAALRWVRAHAKEYHLDPEKIVVWGASAGGHLVSMLGTTQDDKLLDGNLGKHSGVSTKVAGVINFFGPADFIVMNDQGSKMNHDDAASPEGKLLGGKVSDLPEKARQASPFHQVSKDDAPFLTVHGTKDPLVPYVQGKDFDASLDQAGVPSILLTVEGGGHGNGFGDGVHSVVRKFLENHFFGKTHELKDETVQAGS